MLKIILAIIGALLSLFMVFVLVHSLFVEPAQKMTQQNNAALAQIQQMQSMGR